LIGRSRVKDQIEERHFTATERWTGRDAASSLHPVLETTSASGHPEELLKDL
jgi:hypothetical protein